MTTSTCLLHDYFNLEVDLALRYDYRMKLSFSYGFFGFRFSYRTKFSF